MRVIKLFVIVALVLSMAAPVAAQRGYRDASEGASTPTTDTSNMSIEELQERIAELERENEDLQQENERLKQRIEDMSGTSRTPREASSEAASAPVLAIGETYEGEDWSITVTFVEFSPTLTSSFETNTARGIFSIVHITVVNEGNAPMPFPYDDIVLLDSDGRAYTVQFDTLFNLTYAVMGVGGQYEDFQPGLPYETGVIYDIPATSTGLSLSTTKNVFVFELD